MAGIIPPEERSYYESLAADQLDRYKRIYTITAPYPDSELRAIRAMAEALYSFDLLVNGEGGPVQSASVGSVSVSYSGAAAQALDLSEKGREKELYRIACRYLDICRGVG